MSDRNSRKPRTKDQPLVKMTTEVVTGEEAMAEEMSRTETTETTKVAVAEEETMTERAAIVNTRDETMLQCSLPNKNRPTSLNSKREC